MAPLTGHPLVTLFVGPSISSLASKLDLAVSAHDFKLDPAISGHGSEPGAPLRRLFAKVRPSESGATTGIRETVRSSGLPGILWWHLGVLGLG